MHRTSAGFIIITVSYKGIHVEGMVTYMYIQGNRWLCDGYGICIKYIKTYGMLSYIDIYIHTIVT